MKLSVNVKQLIALLAVAFKRRRKVLIKGQPGIGKTDIVKHACKIAGALVIFMHPRFPTPRISRGCRPSRTREPRRTSCPSAI
jgi:MoxR-like ATPase